MEEKVKRESKSLMEALFKEYDQLGSRAVTRDDMRRIVNIIVPNFTQEEELEETMDQYVAEQKYTAVNPKTKQLEVKYQQGAIDFPSAMAIACKFLKRYERRNSDAFAGKGLIHFTDLPTSDSLQIKRPSDAKKRLY